MLVVEGFLESVEIGGEVPRRPQTQAALLADARAGDAGNRAHQPAEYPALSRAPRNWARFRGAMGVEIVTTPLGVMTGREARRKKVGGEML